MTHMKLDNNYVVVAMTQAEWTGLFNLAGFGHSSLLQDVKRQRQVLGSPGMVMAAARGLAKLATASSTKEKKGWT